MKKFKKRNPAFITFFKSHKYIAVVLLLIVSGLFISFGIRYGQYAYNVVRVYYLRTQNFYFNSNKLNDSWISGDPVMYHIDHWSGIDPQILAVTMTNNKDNSLNRTTVDITYDVDVNCYEYDGSNLVTAVHSECFILDSNGQEQTSLQDRVISSSSEYTDTFNFGVKPKQNHTLYTGYKVVIEIVASAKSPYTQTLKGRFEVEVKDYGLDFKIDDEAGRVYLDVISINTDSVDNYVRVNFDKNSLRLDMSNSVFGNTCTYVNDLHGGYADCVYRVETITIDGTNYEYISGIDFKVGGRSSRMLRLFKNGTSIINHVPEYDYDSTDPDSTIPTSIITSLCKLSIPTGQAGVGATATCETGS